MATHSFTFIYSIILQCSGHNGGRRVGGHLQSPWFEWPPCGVLYCIYFYNKPRPSPPPWKTVIYILYIELPRSPSGYFKPLLNPGGGFRCETAIAHGWIGQAYEFLRNRQNQAHRDRRGWFSIHAKHGLLDRRRGQLDFFIFLTRLLYGEVTLRPIYRTNQKRLCE
jgi:hypothetical protein